MNPVSSGLEGVLRHWRALVLLPVATAVLFAALALVLPHWYLGEAIFTPSPGMQNALSGNLQALASQFGVSAGGQGYSVYYFAQVLQSREARRLVATDTLTIDRRRIPVLDLLRASGDSYAERVEDCIKALHKVTTVNTDDQSNLVTLDVLGPSPDAATALAAAYLKVVDSITTESLQSGGVSDWRFASGQADSAAAALRRAEDALEAFYATNRSIASSPALQTEEARLQREIGIRRDIYVNLVQQAEAAKLQAVNNTPSIQVVQPPQSSIKKAKPKASVWGPVAGISAFAFVASWIFFVFPLLPAPLADWFASIPRRMRHRDAR